MKPLYSQLQPHIRAKSKSNKAVRLVSKSQTYLKLVILSSSSLAVQRCGINQLLELNFLYNSSAREVQNKVFAFFIIF